MTAHSRGLGSGAIGSPRPDRDGGPGSIVKSAVWTWEVPVYFFVGGSAGMAGLIAGVVYLMADARGEVQSALPVVSRALWIAFAGALLSPPLLISDLGRPRRFLNMLRRFNRRSTLSVGVWILIAFSAAVSGALWLHGAQRGWPNWPPAPSALVPLLAPALAILTLLGGLLATYTGVLLSATVVPAWNRQRRLLPTHFGLASLASAAAWLVLLGEGGTWSWMMLVVVLADALLEGWMRRAEDSSSSSGTKRLTNSLREVKGRGKDPRWERSWICSTMACARLSISSVPSLR